jgi:hypothetical protein
VTSPKTFVISPQTSTDVYVGVHDRYGGVADLSVEVTDLSGDIVDLSAVVQDLSGEIHRAFEVVGSPSQEV